MPKSALDKYVLPINSRGVPQRSKRFRRTWNQAIDTVINVVQGGLPHMQQLTPNQYDLCDTILQLCDKLRLDEDMSKTNAKLARKYACCIRTITSWRKDGAPLDEGQWAMLDWLAERHCVPRATAKKFAKQLSKRHLKYADLHEDDVSYYDVTSLSSECLPG